MGSGGLFCQEAHHSTFISALREIYKCSTKFAPAPRAGRREEVLDKSSPDLSPPDGPQKELPDKCCTNTHGSILGVISGHREPSSTKMAEILPSLAGSGPMFATIGHGWAERGPNLVEVGGRPEITPKMLSQEQSSRMCSSFPNFVLAARPAESSLVRNVRASLEAAKSAASATELPERHLRLDGIARTHLKIQQLTFVVCAGVAISQ